MLRYVSYMPVLLEFAKTGWLWFHIRIIIWTVILFLVFSFLCGEYIVPAFIESKKSSSNVDSRVFDVSVLMLIAIRWLYVLVTGESWVIGWVHGIAVLIFYLVFRIGKRFLVEYVRNPLRDPYLDGEIQNTHSKHELFCKKHRKLSRSLFFSACVLIIATGVCAYSIGSYNLSLSDPSGIFSPLSGQLLFVPVKEEYNKMVQMLITGGAVTTIFGILFPILDLIGFLIARFGTYRRYL